MSEVNQSGLSKNKKTIAIALLLALFTFGFLNKDAIFNFFSGDDSGSSLAKVTAVKNEVRQKKTASLNWRSSSINDSIHRGDSVSTGNASSALVKFNNGQSLTLDQNTLIVFDQQADTPEFINGNIKLTVNGSMKIKIDNEIVTIDGNGADIQVFKDTKKNKQKIVLLKGESKMTSLKNTVKLEVNKTIETKEVTLKPADYKSQVAKEKLEEVALQPKPEPIKPPAQPEPPKIYNYKLYDYYTRIGDTGLDFTLNQAFAEKPNGRFQDFTPAQLSFKNKVELTGENSTLAQFTITDSTRVLGYVVELSQTPVFTEQSTHYFWARSKFEYPFISAGTYFLRYRKVLADQLLTQYSTSEKFTVLPKKIEIKLSAVKKVKPVAEVIKKEVIAKAPVEKPIIELAPIERKPAAIQEAQSTISIAPTATIRNMKFADSYVDGHVTQGYLTSNRQIEGSRDYPQSYNLGFDILHWNYNQGVKASITKGVVASGTANSVTIAEINYMYRMLVASSWFDTNHFQISGLAGYEMYQNSSTSDFVSSYNLFKIGLGASLPVFSFFNGEIDVMYGVGASNATSLQFSTRLNYYLKPNLSLGIGFKARKYDFVLLSKKHAESLAETFTSLRYHY